MSLSPSKVPVHRLNVGRTCVNEESAVPCTITNDRGDLSLACSSHQSHLLCISALRSPESTATPWTFFSFAVKGFAEVRSIMSTISMSKDVRRRQASTSIHCIREIEKPLPAPQAPAEPLVGCRLPQSNFERGLSAAVENCHACAGAQVIVFNFLHAKFTADYGPAFILVVRFKRQ